MTPIVLITQADELLRLARRIQADELFEDEPGRKDIMQQLTVLYLPWYRAGLTLFARYNRLELQQKFMQEYEGTFLVSKIGKFLKLGWKVYNLYNPKKSDLISSIKWTVQVDRSFEEPLRNQCNYLSAL